MPRDRLNTWNEMDRDHFTRLARYTDIISLLQHADFSADVGSWHAHEIDQCNKTAARSGLQQVQ